METKLQNFIERGEVPNTYRRSGEPESFSVKELIKHSIPPRYRSVMEEEPSSLVKDFIERLEEGEGLYIYGDVGTGKTHLAYSLYYHWRLMYEFELSEIRDRKRDYEDIRRRPHFTSMSNLLAELRYGYQDNDDTAEKKAINGGRKLNFIDDVGAQKITDWVEDVFYRIIDDRYLRMSPIVITSNLSLDQLSESIGDRAVSRIAEMCHVYKVEGKDRRVN